MALLVLGLLLFLSVHSTRIVADGWRSATIARLGAGPWKGLYSLASAVGIGYSLIWPPVVIRPMRLLPVS